MKRRIGKWLAGFVLAGMVLLLADVIWSAWRNQTVRVTNYVIGEKMEPGIRIVLLSDLHNRTFGAHNRELTREIEKADPDLICMTGDMLNADEEDISVMLELMRAAASVAPVYVSYGNHEKEYEERFGTDLKALMEETGVRVLERSWEDIRIHGRRIRIGGLYGYAMPTQPGFDGEEQRFLEGFQETEDEKILLCHMPAAWILWNSLSYWDVDLVLAGHTHGGQIRVPFLGGVYAPDQGWFPGFTAGLLEDDGKYLAVSAGLGSEGWILRLNNRPELVVIDF